MNEWSANTPYQSFYVRKRSNDTQFVTIKCFICELETVIDIRQTSTGQPRSTVRHNFCPLHRNRRVITTGTTKNSGTEILDRLSAIIGDCLSIQYPISLKEVSLFLHEVYVVFSARSNLFKYIKYKFVDVKQSGRSHCIDLLLHVQPSPI